MYGLSMPVGMNQPENSFSIERSRTSAIDRECRGIFVGSD